MAADDDDAEVSPELLREIGEDNPESGTRAKPVLPEPLRTLVREFHRDADGLEGDALQAHVDRLVDRIVESHAAVVPAALRDEVRRTMRTMLESDPTLAPLLRGLRESTARERVG